MPDAGVAPMCGNSIGVDRRFLDQYLPELDRYLHYRSIDVSSFKELCRRWYPEVYKKRPHKAETHRALADVRESIAELRYYREHMLRRAECRPTPSYRQPSSSRSAPRSVVTDRSRAEWPMSPMRHALPGEPAEPAADLDAVGGEQLLAQGGVVGAVGQPRGGELGEPVRRRAPPDGSRGRAARPASGSPTARWRAHAASSPSSRSAPSAAWSAHTIETGAVWWYTRLAPST